MRTGSKAVRMTEHQSTLTPVSSIVAPPDVEVRGPRFGHVISLTPGRPTLLDRYFLASTPLTRLPLGAQLQLQRVALATAAHARG